MRTVGLVALIGLAGCTPLLPFHLGETATVLERRQVSLTVTAGGGDGTDLNQCCGGGAARVSVGVGRHLEVGAESAIMGAGDSDAGTVALSTKLRIKWGPLPYLALVGGLGAQGLVGYRNGNLDGGNPAIGGDVGLIASTPLLARTLRIYGAARLSFNIPAASDIYRSGGPTEGVVIPGGLALELGPRWRLYFEGGFLATFSQNRVISTADVRTNDWYGGYGAFSFAYVWGGPG
jgi:hypothetical protein